MNLMDTDKLRRIQDDVALVHHNAKRAARESDGDRGRAYALLNRWARCDASLEDALNSVGLLMDLKEDLENRGEHKRAASISHLLIGGSSHNERGSA